MFKPGSNLRQLFHLVAIGIGPPSGQLPIDCDGFSDRGLRLLPPIHGSQGKRHVAHRPGQVGAEHVRAGGGELAVDPGGLLADG